MKSKLLLLVLAGVASTATHAQTNLFRSDLDKVLWKVPATWAFLPTSGYLARAEKKGSRGAVACVVEIRKNYVPAGVRIPSGDLSGTFDEAWHRRKAVGQGAKDIQVTKLTSFKINDTFATRADLLYGKPIPSGMMPFGAISIAAPRNRELVTVSCQFPAGDLDALKPELSEVVAGLSL